MVHTRSTSRQITKQPKQTNTEAIHGEAADPIPITPKPLRPIRPPTPRSANGPQIHYGSALKPFIAANGRLKNCIRTVPGIPLTGHDLGKTLLELVDEVASSFKAYTGARVEWVSMWSAQNHLREAIRWCKEYDVEIKLTKEDWDALIRAIGCPDVATWVGPWDCV